MEGPGKAPLAALLDELKLWLRIEEQLEDALLYQLLRAATEAVEAHVGCLLIAREVEERGRVRHGWMRLASRPVRSLIWVRREEGETQTPIVDARLDCGGPGPAMLACPGVHDAEVRVRLVAGSVDNWNGLSEALRLAVVRLAAHFYAHRDGDGDAGIPAAVLRMLAPFRTRRLV